MTPAPVRFHRTIGGCLVALLLAGAALLPAAPQERRPIRVLGGGGTAPAGGSGREVPSLLDRVELGEPVTPPGMPHLLVYPLRPAPQKGRPAADLFTHPGYLSLDEALRRKELIIRERPEPAVPILEVENLSDRPVLILAGEILVGGKQNRILQSDLLLPPRSGRRDVSAYCVEQGRWSSGKVAFEAAGALAPAPIRESAALEKDQRSVWRRIEEAESRAPVASASPTRSLHQIMEDEGVVAEVAPKVARLRGALPGGALGVVVVANGSIYSFDLFSSAPLFEQYRDKILRAAVTGAPDRLDYLKEQPAPDVRAFVRAARDADAVYFGSPGIGSRVELSGAGVKGEALVLDDRVVHMALFLW